MNSRLLPWLTLALCTAVAASAQVSLSLSTSPGAPIGAPNLLTPGLPFQAERVTHTVQHLADGSTLAREVHETLARDAQGRFYDRSQTTAGATTAGGSGEAKRVYYVLADPTAKRVLQWNSLSANGTSFPLSDSTRVTVAALQTPRSAAQTPPNNKTDVKTEALGTRTIAGMETTGARTVTTVPAGTMGNDKDLRIVHEEWSSSALKLLVAELDESPFTGTRTATMVSLKPGAPPTDLFEEPVGLTIGRPMLVGVAPPKPVAALDPARSIYLAALRQYDQTGPGSQDAREKAAAEMVAYAKTHEEVANYVAHMLAERGIRLDDADTLGHESVQRIEVKTTALTLDAVKPSDFETMTTLADNWDALGWLCWSEEDLKGAWRYWSVAWEVSGEGLHMTHLAKIASRNGDREIAQRLLQVAMSGRMSTAQKKRNAEALARLGVDAPVAVAEPTVVVVPSAGLTAGSANFYLEFEAKQKPKVRWIDGDRTLSPAEAAIAAASFPPQLPDEGPEHVIRKGHLVCTGTECRLTLQYAWQAEAVPSGLPSVRLGTP